MIDDVERTELREILSILENKKINNILEKVNNCCQEAYNKGYQDAMDNAENYKKARGC